MKTLILNNSHVVAGSDNSIYSFKFPGGGIALKHGDQIGVQFIQVPYCWYNISAANNNNSFGYKLKGVTYTITITDGFYNTQDLNFLMQSAMYNNGHYLLDSDDNEYYFAQLTTNANLYAIQFDAFVIPQTLPVGYTNPANVLYNTVTFTGDTCMQLYVPDTLFKNIIGFSTGSYPAAVQSTIYSITSNATNAPNLTPVNSIIMRCSLCDNKYTVPPDVMYSFSPNTTFGNNIVINPASIAWIDCKVGSFTQLDIQFMDQNFNPMQWRDSNICVQLLIKSANE
jgi:hypothetical protein